MDDGFLDREAWQRMLAREGLAPALDAPLRTPPGATVGLLRRDEYRAGAGTLLLWVGGAGCMQVETRAYAGVAGDDLGLLFIADPAAFAVLRREGLAPLAAMIRKGQLDPYVLKTMEQLEAAGLADFIEAMDLVCAAH